MTRNHSSLSNSHIQSPDCVLVDDISCGHLYLIMDDYYHYQRIMRGQSSGYGLYGRQREISVIVFIHTGHHVIVHLWESIMITWFGAEAQL